MSQSYPRRAQLKKPGCEEIGSIGPISMLWSFGMPTVKEGDTVTVHYKGSLDDGMVFDSSEGGPPLSFKVGEGQVIEGFDDGIRGMEPGQSRQINIPA